MLTKLKQFKDLRSQAKKMQDELGKESVTTSAAGNKVVMTMNGNMKMTGLAIDDELMTPERKNKLQDAIKDAHEDAMKKMQRIMATKMKEMGGFPEIPGLS